MQVSTDALLSRRVWASLALVIVVIVAAGQLHHAGTDREHEVDMDAPPAELLYSSIDHLQYTDYRYVRSRTRYNSTDCSTADRVKVRGWVENSNRRARFTITRDNATQQIYTNSYIMYEKLGSDSSWTSHTNEEYSPSANLYFGSHDVLQRADIDVLDRSGQTIVLRINRTNTTEGVFQSGIVGTADTERESMTFYLNDESGEIRRVERRVYGHYYGDYCDVVVIEGYGTATADRPDDIGFRAEEVLMGVVKTVARVLPV
jgi:hypothetical protein